MSKLEFCVIMNGAQGNKEVMHYVQRFFPISAWQYVGE